MKLPFYVLITGVLIVLTGQTANKIKVPRVKLDKPVIAQTAPEYVGKRGQATVVRRHYVAKWGVHLFEYGFADYFCDSQTRKCQQVPDTTALRFFENCKGLNQNGKPNCSKRIISARVDISTTDENPGQGRRTWYSCEDYDSPCQDRNHHLDEYPNRYTPEDPENPQGF